MQIKGRIKLHSSTHKGCVNHTSTHIKSPLRKTELNGPSIIDGFPQSPVLYGKASIFYWKNEVFEKYIPIEKYCMNDNIILVFDLNLEEQSEVKFNNIQHIVIERFILGIPASVSILTGLLSALFILARKLSCSKKSSVLEFTINLVNHMQVVDFVGKFEDLNQTNLGQ